VRTPTVFKYENRLAKTLVSSGGVSREEALRSAAMAVEAVREPTIAEIDAQLAKIYLLSETLRAGRDDQALGDMYIASNRIIGLGGIFGFDELGKAAYSLCELVSRFQANDRVDWPLIAVHVDGLKLLRNPDEHPAEQRRDVLEGLNRVAASVSRGAARADGAG
jgi:hypothetical protein